MSEITVDLLSKNVRDYSSSVIEDGLSIKIKSVGEDTWGRRTVGLLGKVISDR